MKLIEDIKIIGNISSLTRRQERLWIHQNRLVKAQKEFIQNINSLQKRIAQGETTGDSVLDYAVNCINPSLDAKFSEAVNKKYEDVKKKLSAFIPNEFCILENDEFIAQLGNPAYVVTPNRQKIHLNALKSFKITETKMKGLELKIYSLEPCKSEDIGSRWSHGAEWISCYHRGWDTISKRFLSGNNPNPILLRSIYEQFGREADDEIYKRADEAYHEIAKKAVLQIDSLSKQQKDLWDKIESKRRKLEELREEAERAKGRIVLSINDQLNKDAAEMNYEMEFLRGINNNDQRREHEYQLRKIEMCLEDAITLGLDTYEESVTIEIMPGEYRVFNVAKYIKTLCSYMEIATNKQMAKV